MTHSSSRGTTGQPVRQRISHRVFTGLALLIVSTLLAGCEEPFIVMSGGALTGEVVDPPVDWSELNRVEIVQLETRPDEPYSVNIWMIGKGADVYVATGDDPTRWSKNIDENPDVRLRVRGMVYELEAVRVEDLQEKESIGAEYVRKYDVDGDDNWVQEGQLFRLDRR